MPRIRGSLGCITCQSVLSLLYFRTTGMRFRQHESSRYVAGISSKTWFLDYYQSIVFLSVFRDGGNPDGNLGNACGCPILLAKGTFKHQSPQCWTTLIYWVQKFLRWLTRKKPAWVWFDVLRDAKTYDEWEEAAFQLDVLLGNDLWYVSWATD